MAVIVASTSAYSNERQARRWLRRGRISEQMGRSEQAIQHYRQAWRHSAELVDAVVWGTRLLLEA
ncbi:MAG: tetratricopeptide repeat protein, partial [Candidatus Latescibacteria bacterium]|nr:tetratricopeptide repeat protein [Candidatus Latescibacterota bacterium]